MKSIRQKESKIRKKNADDCLDAVKVYRFLRSQFRWIEGIAKELADLDGKEACGLLVDNGYFIELIHVRNKTKRGGGFSFYFDDVRIVQKYSNLFQHQIVGTFHSHPVGLPEPGKSDIYNAVNDSLMLIFDVMGGASALWYIEKRRARKLAYRLI